MSANEMIFGDFKVVAKRPGRKVLAECRYCGQRKIYSEATARSGYMSKCYACNPSYRRTKTKKKTYAERKVTEDTKKIVCWYFAEGDDIDDICNILHRNKDEVLRILTACIKNGKYSEYVFLSQAINYQRAMERMRKFKEKMEAEERVKGFEQNNKGFPKS